MVNGRRLTFICDNREQQDYHSGDSIWERLNIYMVICCPIWLYVFSLPRNCKATAGKLG